MHATEVNKNKKKYSKIVGIIATTLYIILLPILFGIAFCSVMVFDKPNLSTPFGLTIIFLYFCVPLSIFPTIYFIWENFSKQKYKKVYFFCILPVLIFAVSVLMMAGILKVNDLLFPL